MNQKIEIKIHEFWKLRNKGEKYWKKLIKESFVIAKKKGLKLKIANGPTIFEEGDIIVYNNQNLYDDSLLNLVKSDFPSLYRKYHNTLREYKKLKEDLARDYNSFK